jgi:hypothetical protein
VLLAHLLTGVTHFDSFGLDFLSGYKFMN